jgi:hypothetical protein
MTGPLFPVGILNPIRVSMGIPPHRFNLSGKRSSAKRCRPAGVEEHITCKEDVPEGGGGLGLRQQAGRMTGSVR